MKRVLTEHVVQLCSSVELDHAELSAFWPVFQTVLVSEMKSRGLYRAPPAYLGYPEYGTWSDTTIFELRQECYICAILERLWKLHAHLSTKDNVDGLIFRNVRFFLSARQRRFDPVGSLVYENLLAAVEGALSDGVLVFEGEKQEAKIRSGTVLRTQLKEKCQETSLADFDCIIQSWGHQLLCDLALASRAERATAIASLRGRLTALASAGIKTFRFQDILNPLRSAVRLRLHELLRQEVTGLNAGALQDGSVVAGLPLGFDSSWENARRFRRLVLRVSASVEELGLQQKSRERLMAVLNYLVAGAENPKSNGRPSQRTIAEELKIPRGAIPELLDTLRRIIKDFNEAPPA